MPAINHENIDWTNIITAEDKSQGKIISVSTWKTWNCLAREWDETKPPTILRNILLGAMHPNNRFAIGNIPETTTDPSLLNPIRTDAEAYELDLASGSRNHGNFTFNNSAVGPFYFANKPEDQWRRIIYGSIVHTGCKQLIYLVLNYIISDDEQVPDDPTNNIHWSSGDSHAKCSKKIMKLLGLPAVPDDPGSEADENRPIQFRGGLFKEWVAKGTVAYNPALDSHEADIVIPLSCLKGNKPALGNYSGKLLFGLVFEAENRRAKPGWMFFQWFSFETLEQDGIIADLEAKCEELAIAYDDIEKLAEILRIGEDEYTKDEINADDGVTSEVEYVNNMTKIIQADKNGLLLTHPWLVSRIRDRLREVWLTLAKAAGVRFHSVLAQPDEALAHYHTILPDGRVEGQKVFCAPDYPPGEYILFINPMRHWGDTQLWENKHEGTYAQSTGVIAAPIKLLLTLGRDVDGDFIQLIRSDRYPHIRQAIADFSDAPVTEKFPKMALPGSLQEIAIGSMNDKTGIVASLLGRAAAYNAENIVLEIPPGGEQKSAQEMRIIDFLSQQLQIAVDSLKSAYPNNDAGLDAVKKFLDKQKADIPWLKGFKDKDTYRIKPCPVKESAPDTISRLVRLVNSHWVAPDLQTGAKPENFQQTLYGEDSGIYPNDHQLNLANHHRLAYAKEMTAAIAWKEENDGNTMRIRQVVEKYRQLKEKIVETRNDAGEVYPRQTWAAAFWSAAHKSRSGTAGVVFTMFTDEICMRLMDIDDDEAKVLRVYAVQYGKWAAPQDSSLWNGQLVNIRASSVTVTGKIQTVIHMEWDGAKKQKGYHFLGRLGGKTTIALGTMKRMKIYSVSWKQGVTTGVMLFSPSMRQEEILNLLTRKNRKLN